MDIHKIRKFLTVLFEKSLRQLGKYPILPFGVIASLMRFVTIYSNQITNLEVKYLICTHFSISCLHTLLVNNARDDYTLMIVLISDKII